MPIKVGIVGYGTIGKRVADAVLNSKDMEISGITARSYACKLDIAKKREFPLYVVGDGAKDLEDRGFIVKGNFDDICEDSDIIVDATPSKVPISNLPVYDSHKVKALVQGGEKHDLMGFSFSSLANYEQAINRDRCRVVSCNTTGLSRLISTIDQAYCIDDVFVSLIRRAADPKESKKGPINAVKPVLGISHHGPDVKTVMPHINIYSMAVAVPHTLSHVHTLRIKLKKETTKEDVVALFNSTPRIVVGKGSEGYGDTALIAEYYRDMRLRYDMPELFIWDEPLDVNGKYLYIMASVHQESIVVPENVDCIKAMCGMEQDKMKAIYETDKAMGIEKSKKCYF